MEHVRQEINKTVEQLVRTLKERLGPALQSLTLIGSAVTDDFVAGKSDINSVLVVDKVNNGILSSLSQIGPSMGRKRLRAPLLMTPAYIERSCDVFAVEWLDFQAFHHTICGQDPFVSLTFSKEDVRLQCERQFKSLQIQLQQGYINSAEKKHAIAALLTNVAKELAPYLRAMLWLRDSNRPACLINTFDQVKTLFSVDMDAFKTAYSFRYRRLHESAEQIRGLFVQASDVIESLSGIADQWRA
ncbi:MAG: hypothetical protein LLF76_08330 [Planctomycetaceae bacterium]|nr:hypothetical protein [Planctomycetaceae bacterium]